MTRSQRQRGLGRAALTEPHGRRLVLGWRRPARLVTTAFAAFILVGTLLLMHPAASSSDEPTALLTALFTATSAVTVTGLVVVDTPTYWSTFGEAVILGLVQVGGLGIMTIASMLGFLFTQRLMLRMQLSTQAETPTLSLGEVRRVGLGVIVISAFFELLTAVFLIPRLVLEYGEAWPRAIWLGVFHAISAFNQAGFALYSDSLEGFVTDGWVSIPITIAIIAGGIGFPVWIELWRRRLRPRNWSLHAKITLWVTGVLVVVGTGVVLLGEWRNPATLGPLGVDGKLLAGLFHGVTPRSAGLNTLDVGAMQDSTLLATDVLMFIGGGSASTAGGIKVTTFALLAYVIYAEIRGEPSVHAMGRRLPATAQRQALTIALLYVGLVIVATLILVSITPFRLEAVLFEVISAAGTVGLTTGITDALPPTGQVILILLMFIGRIGPATLASGLALRERTRRYELPEERPIVG